MGKHKFPTLAVGLLVVGVLWLLTELEVLMINVPWIPIILIVVSLGMVLNRYFHKQSY